ncbi:hypothetical protein [Kribbella jiaozuonensis]|uniref:Uncharacterized protein n=1 Tax=Kribbella jiaozuonensis TaxID=2575441 RepID=A0A4U3LDA2_9ACTN|nr:hypothetical protein [Kribbella jiaozuonensis]TKK73301.1 hypothetical protein FDA38_38965 [Kribbella jiaozuonensis]
MPETAERVPEDSATYREFTRLYDLARQLRPTVADRWNRELYATSGRGGFDQDTGAIGIHKLLLREGLTRDPAANPRRQARALDAVLHRATQAGMELEAPGAVNAIRTTQSRGLHDGVAAVRAADDFEAFTELAGYEGLSLDGQQFSGAYAAANGLIEQASGPRVDRRELIGRLSQGPAVMHFDQLAEAVVRNRLQEVAPAEGRDREAVRRELIGTMLHPRWDSLAQRSPEAGRQVAEEIGRALNSKVEELRRTHPWADREGTADGVRQQGVEQAGRQPGNRAEQPGRPPEQRNGDLAAARFLSGVAPAAGAAGQGSALGDGSRAAAAQAAGAARGAARGAAVRRDGSVPGGPRGSGGRG